MTYKEKLKKISTFVFDFDGVLTDGTVYLLPPDQFIRTMNVRDSFAIQHAVKMGFRIAIITGGNNEMVRERMNYLGVKDVFLQSADKLQVYKKYLADNHLTNEEVMYAGDDLPDFPVLKHAGVSVCPQDAVEEVKAIVDYVSPKCGGKGCVRDMIEQTLKIHDKWMGDHIFNW